MEQANYSDEALLPSIALSGTKIEVLNSTQVLNFSSLGCKIVNKDKNFVSPASQSS